MREQKADFWMKVQISAAVNTVKNKQREVIP
jgi:hypothetical protein